MTGSRASAAASTIGAATAPSRKPIPPKATGHGTNSASLLLSQAAAPPTIRRACRPTGARPEPETGQALTPVAVRPVGPPGRRARSPRTPTPRARSRRARSFVVTSSRTSSRTSRGQPRSRAPTEPIAPLSAASVCQPYQDVCGVWDASGASTVSAARAGRELTINATSTTASQAAIRFTRAGCWGMPASKACCGPATRPHGSGRAAAIAPDSVKNRTATTPVT